MQPNRDVDAMQEILIRRRQMEALWRLSRNLSGKVELPALLALCGSIDSLRV